MSQLNISLLKEVEANMQIKKAYAPPPPFLNPELQMQQGAPQQQMPQQPGMMPQQPQQPGMMPQQPPQQGGGMDPNQALQQVVQAVQVGFQEGIPPEKIQNDLVASGIPQEIVQQAMQMAMSGQPTAGEAPVAQQQGQPPQEASMAPPQEPPVAQSAQEAPLDINAMMEEAIKSDKEKRNVPPEELLEIHDRKIDMLTELMQQLLNKLG